MGRKVYMKVDYNNIEAPQGVMPGTYDVKVCAFDIKTSSNGNPVIVLDYKVREDVEQEFAGSKVRYDNFIFTPSGAWRINAIAKVTGIPNGFDFTTPEDFGKTMMHRNLRIVVGERIWKEKKYPTVTKFMPSMNLMPQPGMPNKDGFQTIPDSVMDEGLPFN